MSGCGHEMSNVQNSMLAGMFSNSPCYSDFSFFIFLANYCAISAKLTRACPILADVANNFQKKLKNQKSGLTGHAQSKYE